MVCLMLGVRGRIWRRRSRWDLKRGWSICLGLKKEGDYVIVKFGWILVFFVSFVLSILFFYFFSILFGVFKLVSVYLFMVNVILSKWLEIFLNV